MGMHLIHRVLIVSFLLILGMPVARAQEYCAPVVIKQLSQLGVGSDRVEEIIYANSMSGGENVEIVAVEAWVKLRSCNGQLVIVMTPGCRFIRNYTQKECRVQGVRHSC